MFFTVQSLLLQTLCNSFTSLYTLQQSAESGFSKTALLAHLLEQKFQSERVRIPHRAELDIGADCAARQSANHSMPKLCLQGAKQRLAGPPANKSKSKALLSQGAHYEFKRSMNS